METAPISLPPELRTALDAQGGLPLHIHDHETQKIYLLMEQGTLPSFDEQELQRLLQPALDDEARGDVALLDMDAIKNEGRRILARRQAQRDQ
jgi:hypothetical protein